MTVIKQKQNIYVVLLLTLLIDCCYVNSTVNRDYLKKVGMRVRALRKKNKLTQEELAAKFNNHGEQVGRIERGEQNVTVCTLLEIANALDISMSELFNFE